MYSANGDEVNDDFSPAFVRPKVTYSRGGRRATGKFTSRVRWEFNKECLFVFTRSHLSNMKSLVIPDSFALSGDLWKVFRMRNAVAFIALVFSALLLAGCDSPEVKLAAHYEQGLKLAEKGQLVKARLEFRNALSFDKKHVPSLLALAQVNQRLENWQRAVDLYTNITIHDPEHLNSRIVLANIMLAAEQFEGAVKFSDEAYNLAPKDRRVLVLKGAVALELAKPIEAVRFAEAALELDPHDTDALMLRAAERIKAGDAQGALDFLNRGEEKDARNVALQLFKIRTLGALSDQEGIENVLRKLIEYYPDNLGMRYALVRFYQSTGDHERTEKAIRQLAADFPDDSQVGLALINYLAREKGFEAAKGEILDRIERFGGIYTYQQSLAQLNFAEGKYDDAYRVLTDFMSGADTSPEGKQAKILLARMKAERGNLEEAETLVTAVLEEDQKNATALSVRSAIRLIKKDYTTAIEDLRSALGEEPESVSILQQLANAYELNGSVELAEEHFAKATILDGFKPGVGIPYVQFLLRYGKTDQAERTLVQIRSASPSERRVLILLSRLKLAKQDWLGAQEVAEALREIETTEGVADRILAEVLAGQKKYEESNNLLKSSVSNSANNTAPLARYVENLVRGGKTSDAIAFLKEILATEPEHARARILLGSVYEVDGQLNLAKSALQDAANRDQDSVTGHDALARYFIRRSDLESAKTTIREALARKKDSLALRLLLASVLERTGQYEEAISEYTILFESSPQSTVIANNLASLLADYGDEPEHIERAYSIAVRFRGSKIPYFQDTLGWIYYLKHDYEKAVRLLKSSAAQLENVGLAQYHLGMTYKALGQNELAIKQLEKAIELSQARPFAQLESAQSALNELKSVVITQ